MEARVKPEQLKKVIKRKDFWKNIGMYILMAIFTAWIFFGFLSPTQSEQKIPITQVLNLVNEEKVKNITVSGNDLEITTKDDQKLTSKKGSEDFLVLMETKGVDASKITEGVTITESSPWLEILVSVLGPVLAFGLLFYFIMGRGNKGVFSLGRSRAKLFSPDSPKTKFKDVGGSDEVKEELAEVVDFLKMSEKYKKLGARVPKGVLLVGPAGVGKTLLARAIAGEANVPFFSVAGSEFMEMIVGVGASRVRDLFAMAKKVAPAIIFIDEIDAIGRQRGYGISGGHDEREQTLNQILVEMDGFDARTNVILVAATNRPDLLDQALTRPGRFDRRISLDLPDIAEREEIIKVHMEKKPFAKDFDIKKIARRTVGYSGADLENTLNEAAILAARRGAKEITMKDLEDAATKVKLGPEKKRMQSEQERKMTAYHEAGHALVSAKLPGTDPVHRISIVSRGHSLGHTMIPPKIDRYNETQSRLESLITSLLGGRAAEKLKFNDLTVGASNDIDQATLIAKKMVTEFGMSPLGPIAIDSGDKSWMRGQMGEYNQVSDNLAAKVDSEVSAIIDKSFKKAQDILRKNEKLLDKISAELIEKETLEQDEFESIIMSNGKVQNSNQ